MYRSGCRHSFLRSYRKHLDCLFLTMIICKNNHENLPMSIPSNLPCFDFFHQSSHSSFVVSRTPTNNLFNFIENSSVIPMYFRCDINMSNTSIWPFYMSKLITKFRTDEFLFSKLRKRMTSINRSR